MLWLAVAGIVVLIFWGIARQFVSSNLRHEAAADVESSLCEVVAESAVAEAEARIGYRVNALDDPLAEQLRGQVLAAESGEIDLTSSVVLTQTQAMMQDPIYRGYSIDRFEARVAFQKQIDNVPTEKRALFTFSVSVSSPGLVRRSARKLEIGRWAKIALVTPPRPFGLFGLFVVDATGLTDASAVNAARDRALDVLKQVRAALKAAAPAGSAAQPAVDELLAGTFDPEGTLPAPAPLTSPDGAAFYGLAESREPQRLRDLDLAVKMRELVEKAERAAAGLQAAAGDPAQLPVVGRAALTAAVAPLLELWNFQRNYMVLTAAAGKPAADLASLTYKLTEEYYQRRAHYVVKEGAGKGDVSAQLKELLDGPAQGVVLVENQKPVTVTGAVPGRVVLVVGPGGANLRSVNASDQATGMVTVVSATGPLRVSGKCSVNLLLVDSAAGRNSTQLALDRDAQIHGSLIATAMPAGGFREGELERDDRAFSGFTDPTGKEVGLSDRFYVGLSPRIFFRRMSKL